MKTTVVGMHYAKAHFSELVSRAEKGERIVITKAKKAVAQPDPIAKIKSRLDAQTDPLLRVEEYSFKGPIRYTVQWQHRR